MCVSPFRVPKSPKLRLRDKKSPPARFFPSSLIEAFLVREGPPASDGDYRHRGGGIVLGHSQSPLVGRERGGGVAQRRSGMPRPGIM